MDQRDVLIQKAETEIAELRRALAEKEKILYELKNDDDDPENPYCGKLTSNDVARYSRQMILPEISVEGQLKLKASKILVVGAGGLGCPAALYLTAAGVGNITILDGDEVELCNLHRQILHSQFHIGLPKVESAKISLNRLNDNVNITALHLHLTSSNIIEILSGYDIVIDGTDNVASRYLLNDACVLENKPLVSGSALKFEGQLTVYHFKGGPCYRCLFPVPPPPESVTTCGDGGVFGTVPGCIGVLQAMETIKMLLGMPDILSGKLLLFDGQHTTFRKVSLRQRSSKCAVCGDNPTVTAPIDYEQFCNAQSHDKGDMLSILSSSERVSVNDYDKLVKENTNHYLIDVRPKIEYAMCHLPNAINIPFIDIEKNLHKKKIKNLERNVATSVFVLCRRGNDSQRAVKIFREQFKALPFQFKDIIGGLHAFSAEIDSRFPVY